MDLFPDETLSLVRQEKLAQIARDCAAAIDVVVAIVIGCAGCPFHEDAEPVSIPIEQTDVPYGAVIN